MSILFSKKHTEKFHYPAMAWQDSEKSELPKIYSPSDSSSMSRSFASLTSSIEGISRSFN